MRENLGEELFGALARRFLKELLLGAVFKNLARFHKDHAVSDLTGKAISCVTTIIVMPSPASCTMTSRTSLIISGSSAEVGSSKSMQIGSIARARAIAHALLLAARELTGEFRSLL